MTKIRVEIDIDLEDLIPGYLQNRADDITAMRSAIADNDLDSVRVTGHSMKGSGGAYGFDRITEIGAALEIAARDGDTSALEPLIAELEQYIDAVEPVFVE